MEESSENRLHALDYWQVIRNRYGIILLAFLLIFSTAVVITYIIPKEYSGRVQLELNGDDQRVKVGQDRVDLHPLLANNFLETEFEVIQSKETLYRVIDELKLMERWGARTRPEVYQMLLSDLEAEATRGTNIVTIEVLSEDWDEASEIANQVAKSYTERREEVADEQISKGLDTLMEQITAQRALVASAEKTKMDIQREHGVIELNGSSSNGGITGTQTVDNMALPRIMEQILEKRRELDTIRTTIEILSLKTGDELISQAVELGVDNETIRTMEPRYKDLRLKERELMGSGLGKRHPKIVAVNNQIAEARTMLESAVLAYRNSLPTKKQIAEESYAKLETMASEAEEASIGDPRALRRVSQCEGGMGKAEAPPRRPGKILRPRKCEPADVPHPGGRPRVGGAGFESGKTERDPEPRARWGRRPRLRDRPRLLPRIHGHQREEPRRRRALPPGSRPRGHPERCRHPPPAERDEPGRGGLPHPPHEHRIQPWQRRGELYHRRLGRGGRGEINDLGQPRLRLRPGRVHHAHHRWRPPPPPVHTFFNIPNHVGLSNYLTSDTPLEQVVLRTPIDNLYFMPSGILPADAAGILNSQRMSELIADVKSRFDLVLIDSPPILGVSDASVLAAECDLTMIVVQHRKLPRNMLMRVKQGVQNVGGKLLGVVLNNVDVRSDSQYRYYTSYYTYYTPNNTAPKKQRSRKSESADPQIASQTTPGQSKGFGDDFFGDEY